MISFNISNKILHWYDNNKRDLPWRKPRSLQQSQYFTLVSEIMLQQTQVITVVPYFNKFIKELPDFVKLSNVSDKKLYKLWEGLGYYSRASNLKKAANIIVNKYKKKLPNTLKELKELPGIGEYTSRAILSLEFNKKVIPLDGNIERLLKRVLYLKRPDEISKTYLMEKVDFFGHSNRQRDYVQSLMELGALVCKPIDPKCNNCPITKYCSSFKYKDFKIKKKEKKNMIKYFESKVYINKNKIFLVKNNKFNFLKNFFIFPMHEINKNKFISSKLEKTEIKLSNIIMKIIINKRNNCPKEKGLFLNLKKIDEIILPSFTKKLYKLSQNLK